MTMEEFMHASHTCENKIYFHFHMPSKQIQICVSYLSFRFEVVVFFCLFAVVFPLLFVRLSKHTSLVYVCNTMLLCTNIHKSLALSLPLFRPNELRLMQYPREIIFQLLAESSCMHHGNGARIIHQQIFESCTFET